MDVNVDALWGAQLISVRFDPVSHACDLMAEATDGAVMERFLIACSAVRNLRFHNGIPLPWTFAEIMEAHLTRDDVDGLSRLELMLWSEDAGLVIDAQSIEVNAE